MVSTGLAVSKRGSKPSNARSRSMAGRRAASCSSAFASSGAAAICLGDFWMGTTCPNCSQWAKT